MEAGTVQPGSGIIKDIYLSLKSIINLLNRHQALDPTTFRVRVLLDAITASLTLATVTTCGTVTNVTNVGGIGTATASTGHDAKLVMLYPMDRSSWALNVRPRIS